MIDNVGQGYSIDQPGNSVKLKKFGGKSTKIQG
jgi:hypothetical protein